MKALTTIASPDLQWHRDTITWHRCEMTCFQQKQSSKYWIRVLLQASHTWRNLLRMVGGHRGPRSQPALPSHGCLYCHQQFLCLEIFNILHEIANILLYTKLCVRRFRPNCKQIVASKLSRFDLAVLFQRLKRWNSILCYFQLTKDIPTRCWNVFILVSNGSDTSI